MDDGRLSWGHHIIKPAATGAEKCPACSLFSELSVFPVPNQLHLALADMCGMLDENLPKEAP